MSSLQLWLQCSWGAIVLPALAVGGCAEGNTVLPRAEDGPGHGGLQFVDVTQTAGLADFRHENGAAGNRFFPETMSGGVAFIDFDGDGWSDILLVGGGLWNDSSSVRAVWLFHNQRDGTFADVTSAAGLEGVRAYGMGLAIADFDGDGDEDFLLTTTEGNLLFRNDGRRFTEVASEVGLSGENTWSSSALFFDATRNGLPDLVVGNYVEWSPQTDKWCMAGNVKSYCTPEIYPGAQSRFYENRGGVFVDRTESAGFVSARGKTLGVASADVDGDGWTDIILANDTEPDQYFRNRGDGTFEEIGVSSGMALDERGQARAGMGVDVGVIDATGHATIVVGNFSNEMVGLYRYSSDGLFHDRAAASRMGGASRRTLAFGLFFFDADLDGDQDAFVANGHIIPEVDEVDDDIRYRQPPHLFLNDGHGNFVDAVRGFRGALTQPLVARGAAYADYDRDGDLDILVVENGGGARLFQNQIRQAENAAHYLRLRLVGVPPGTSALGARVDVFFDGDRQVLTVKSGSSYLSQSELPLTFGLGRSSEADSLVITWASGLSQRFESVAANQDLVIREGGELEPDAAPGSGHGAAVPQKN